jgi:hypothetical protein
MNNRYYVQRLTEQIFLVRENLSAHGAPGADDPIIRSFQLFHDASLFANSKNEAQRTHQNVAVAERDTPSEKPLPNA